MLRVSKIVLAIKRSRDHMCTPHGLLPILVPCACVRLSLKLAALVLMQRTFNLKYVAYLTNLDPRPQFNTIMSIIQSQIEW